MKKITEWSIRYEPTKRAFIIQAPLLETNTQILRELGARTVGTGLKSWILPEIKYTELGKLRLDGRRVEAYDQFVSLLTKGLDLTHLSSERSNTIILRDFQRVGVSALVGQSLLLGDDMGTGKSIQAGMAYRDMKEGGMADGIILIVPNEDVGDQWEAMFGKEMDYSVTRIKNRNNAGFLFPGISIISYSKVWREGYFSPIANVMRKSHTILCLDEAHNVSGHTSKQFDGVRELSYLACRVWALTGTEVANKPDSYWCLYSLVTGSRVTRDDFCNYFCEFFDQKLQLWDIERLKALGVLRRIFALRRLKQDVAKELPPRRMSWVYVEMPAQQRKLYNDLKKMLPVQLDDGDEVKFLTNYSPMLRCCSHPGLVNPDAWVWQSVKLDRLVELIREAGTQKVLIWSNWPATIDWLHKSLAPKLPSYRIESVHGSVSKERRAEIMEAHKAKQIDILIANPAVWKEGVELTAASVVVCFDYHPSRTRWQQALDRVYRIGQTLPVSIYLLAYPDSMDTKTVMWIREKNKLSKLITGK